MIYLDYNATTPLCDEARRAMEPFLKGEYGNPSSIHAKGRAARAGVDLARETFGDSLGVRPPEITFTSGGTEANNLAILGLARAHRSKGQHLITVATEHHAVLGAFNQLVANEGFTVTVLPVDRDGLLDPGALDAAIRPDTILFSAMSANNETGTCQPIAECGEITRRRGILFHSDMVQSFGKQPIEIGALGVDAVAIAAHKFYGPKGVGVLWVRSGVPVFSNTYGGAHEGQRRAGTENVAGIVGSAAAARFVLERMEATRSRIATLPERLWSRIKDEVPSAVRNGSVQRSLGNTLNISFEGCDGESLLMNLDLDGVAVSSGSACMVGSMEASHVLLAMGVPEKLARASVRFSFGMANSEAEIEEVCDAVKRAVLRSRVA